MCRSTRSSGCTRACRRMCCSCSTRPMRNTSASNDYEAGIELVATSENVVMTRTFSKIHGLAALRLGWMYGPAHVIDAINRIRGPFNVNGPAIAAGIAAIEDAAHQERSREHNTKWLGWLTDEIGKLGLKVTPSVANFVLIHFADDKGRTAADANAFLIAARPDPAPGRGLQAAACAAHVGRHRGGQPAGGRRRSPNSWESRRERAADLQSPGADRLRPDRRLDRARGAGAGRWSARSSPRRARRRRESASPSSASPTRWSRPTPPRSKAPTSSSSASRSAPAATVAKEIGPHLMQGATVSDVGSVKGSVLRDMAPHLPPHVHFVPAHPVAGTENSGPDSGFAELFVNRWCILTPPRRRRQSRGREARGVLARARRQCRDACRPTTMTSCSASPATCRT